MRYLVTAVLGLALIAGVANAAEKEWGTRPQPYKATFDMTEHFVRNETDGELVVYENSYDPNNRPVTMTITDENEVRFQGISTYSYDHALEISFRSNQMKQSTIYHGRYWFGEKEVKLSEADLFKEILSCKKFGFILDGREYLFDMDYPAVDQARNFFHQ